MLFRLLLLLLFLLFIFKALLFMLVLNIQTTLWYHTLIPTLYLQLDTLHWNLIFLYKVSLKFHVDDRMVS